MSHNSYLKYIVISNISVGIIMYSIVLKPIFHEYLNKNNKINTRFAIPAFWPLRVNKTGFNLIFFLKF